MIPSDSPRAAGATAGTASRPPLVDRAGYDEHFLGVPVPLPVPSRPEVETVVLPYTHFTVVLRPDRRMAAATAVCIDGRRLLENVPRESGWQFDPRLDEAHQTGNDVYRDNSLDRGHLVRRLDPVWGTAAEANQANEDTFHYTNAAPQADVFNQGKQLWQGLENYLLDHAADFDRKLAVLTGPVLHDSDPPYRGVQVPLRFWKVAAFLQDGALAATAYVLDQSPDLTRDAERALAGAQAGAPPPLGAFRTFQVPVKDVAELTSLDLGPLPAVDLMPVVLAPAERWKRLASYDDIMLQRG
ncbi:MULTISPECIES: DNA/RNA non-specific endonuclease [Streptomyces]|uniref:DNA/RNA non-specific endonuclease n=2 Tax=Streptomyces nigrescens TaxID=1920 RepID=A0ABY7IPP5_STRNI|nr:MULTISPECIES: DNA/RNA non-specific endonuclease [Streptomyces]MCX5445328.1 DNA/RNA non-specific endonuclease [Streptomyces libani]WAU08675.1 DNA/RNA non-specific endonuclease [Streptomyces nigrescens]AWN25628.1 DNA/RNA non-specific endonuclease [Streptomyces sp. NEAU-S7GS2]MYT14729.1 DNA/RNA non-specific endonuclease [Streptomyces sp. SID4951]WAU00812.1 DNA/RNA non-specific endonuclease [Streptomyces libani subsp. libani]